MGIDRRASLLMQVQSVSGMIGMAVGQQDFAHVARLVTALTNGFQRGVAPRAYACIHQYQAVAGFHHIHIAVKGVGKVVSRPSAGDDRKKRRETNHAFSLPSLSARPYACLTQDKHSSVAMV